MEARLLHASKIPTINPQTREWRIINPLKFGIRVDPSQIPEQYTEFFCSNITPDVGHFLTELAGEGGPWDGWTLCAVGDVMYTKDPRDPTPYFQLVFVRRERVAKERGGEGSEMVGGREGLKSEDFPVVKKEFSPAAREK